MLPFLMRADIRVFEAIAANQIGTYLKPWNSILNHCLNHFGFIKIAGCAGVARKPFSILQDLDPLCLGSSFLFFMNDTFR